MTFAAVRNVGRVILGRFSVAAVVLTAGAAPVFADGERPGKVRITKDCTGFGGEAGGSCEITVSNVRRIPVGSRVLYSQAAGVPAGLLDSNVVLDAGHGNRAFGRCTVDLQSLVGLCTFSDGTGRLAGFHARVDVTFVTGNLWAWNGTYGFDEIDD